jgi:hypothetical protein
MLASGTISRNFILRARVDVLPPVTSLSATHSREEKCVHHQTCQACHSQRRSFLLGTLSKLVTILVLNVVGEPMCAKFALRATYVECLVPILGVNSNNRAM